MSVPQTSPEGWFEPTVGQADPLDWPWALPALFCINFARDSGNELVGFSSKLNGSSQSFSRFEDERYRVETIGFWRGDYRVVDLLRFKNRTRAERHALDQFEALPVRYLMEAGVVVQEKPEIDVSGNWPVDWQFGSIRDLGVFCAYIYERALVKKSHEFARDFRGSIGAAWPLTELIANYQRSLQFAKQHVSAWGLPQDQLSLDNALVATQRMLSKIAKSDTL